MSGLSRSEKVVLAIAVLGVVVLGWAAKVGLELVRSGHADRMIMAWHAVRRSENAAGSSELKELGCDMPMISSFGDLLDVKDGPSQGAGDSATTASVNRDMPVVACSTFTGSYPECAVVARRFAQAAKPTGSFVVIAGPFASPGAWLAALRRDRDGFRKQESCAGVFSAAGDPLGPVDGSTLRRPS
jgi:hypothetical protein